MIKDYIEQAIRSIEAEKEQTLATVKIGLQDKLVPRNTEIDTRRDMALQELQTNLEAEILALRTACDKKRQEIIDASEASKAANMQAALSAEVGNSLKLYDDAIANLKILIAVKE